MRPGTLLRWHALKAILSLQTRNKRYVLDIGSYDGAISQKIKKLQPTCNIVVIDVDDLGLSLAKDKRLKAVKASALKLPLLDQTIDLVLCLDILEHVTDDAGVIKEIARVLKSGGELILTTPKERGLTFPFCNPEKNEILNKSFGHLRMGYSKEQIRQLFNEHKLLIFSASEYFNYFSRFAYWLNSFSELPFAKAKRIVFNLLARLEPYVKIGAQEYILIGKKS